MYGFDDILARFRGFMLRDFNAMKESDIQDLLARSFDLLGEVKEMRYRLTVALYNRLKDESDGLNK